MMDQLTNDAIDLLARMISIPSLSREEDIVCNMLEEWMTGKDLSPQRFGHNLICKANDHKDGRPIILLNSHMDTVKASDRWTYDPHLPTVKDGKLHGLGSNDAGASVVSLLAAFRYLKEQEDLPYHLMIAITAEEEISGKNGIESLLPRLPDIDLAIVGEPTEMKIAVAERGLMVLDVEVTGKTGHAARNEGDNAIYKALEDIHWFQTFAFPKKSDHLGPVSMAVTQIKAGTQHNVVPDTCKFVVDVRLNDQYSHQEVVDLIHEHIHGRATARSMRLQPSGIAADHWILKTIEKLGIDTFGSATMSDQALIPYDSIKMGPGRSERSHTPDEFIYLQEIENGIKEYVRLLENMDFSHL